MKRGIILILGLILSSVSFAEAEKDTTNVLPILARVSELEPGKIALIVAQADKVAFIKLRDERGNLIYENKVYLKKGITQPFDISNLGPGKYRFTIDTGDLQTDKIFVIESAYTNRTIQIL